MAERPTTLHSEPIPGRVHNEHRLHHSESPALEFQDGDAVFVLHGTIVPDWVVRDPTAERIARERNVEIRRCAIERIGWDTYIDAADLALVDQADDPAMSVAPAALRDPGRLGAHWPYPARDQRFSRTRRTSATIRASRAHMDLIRTGRRGLDLRPRRDDYARLVRRT